MSKDARSSSNGFHYQRRYAIYYLLSKDDIKEIIEEGNIDGKIYEDITIKFNNNTIESWQLKYHQSDPEGLSKSSDIYKAFGNKDNIKLDGIHYVVSKKDKKSNYTTDMINWKYKKWKTSDIYDYIKNLNLNTVNKNQQWYDKTIKLFDELVKDKTIEYLNNKFILLYHYAIL